MAAGLIRLTPHVERIYKDGQLKIVSRGLLLVNKGTVTVEVNTYPIAPGETWNVPAYPGEIIDFTLSIRFILHNAAPPIVKELWVHTVINNDALNERDINL